MLGTLAAITLMVGSISSTMVLTEENRLAAEEVRAPLVEVQEAAIHSYAPRRNLDR